MQTTFLRRLRQLAKSIYYQNLFHYSKEMNFKLFENDSNLTDVQMKFLQYLDFYSSLYLDCAMGDIDEKIFEDEIYEDAYHSYKLYQRKKDREENFENKFESKKNKETVPGSSWVFRGKK